MFSIIKLTKQEIEPPYDIGIAIKDRLVRFFMVTVNILSKIIKGELIEIHKIISA